MNNTPAPQVHTAPAAKSRLQTAAWAYCTAFTLAIGGCAGWFVGDDPASRHAFASDRVDAAYVNLANGEIDEAKALLIDAVEIAPDHGEARNALGVLLMLEGNLADAIVQFEWATTAKEQKAAYHYHLALAHMAGGSVGFATPSLNRALELDPDFLPAKEALLFAYMELGRWDRAARLRDELTAVYKGAVPAKLVYASGLIAFAEERSDEARALLEKAYRELDTDPVPAVALGLLYEVHGHLDKAETAYKLALKRAPQDAYVHLILADLYHKTGRYSQAEKHLRFTLGRSAVAGQLPPQEQAEALFQLADVGYQLGNYRTSELYRRRSLTLLAALKDREISIDAAAHYALGLIELERDNVDAAIREFTLALRGNDKFTLAWARLSEALQLKAGLSPIQERLPHLEKAQKAAEKAQELAPRLALGYYLEGKALIAIADLQEPAFRAGTLREALFALEQAKRASDPPADIPVYQATILSDIQSHVEAAATLSEARRAMPSSFDLAFLEAIELAKAEKYKEARLALIDAYKIDAQRPELGPTMSLVLFKLGDVAGAARAMMWEPGPEPLPGLGSDVTQPTSSAAAP